MSFWQKIWIVQYHSCSYDCESYENIKGFTDKYDAELYKKNIDDKSEIATIKLNDLFDEKIKEVSRLNSKNITSEERISEMLKISAKYNKKSDKIIKEAGKWAYFSESDSIEIDELDILVKE